MLGRALVTTGTESEITIENLQITGVEFTPEALEFLRQFLTDLRSASADTTSDPFNVGINDFGRQRSTHQFSTDPVRTLMAAQVLRGKDTLGESGSVDTVMSEGRHMLAERALDDLSRTLNKKNIIEIINALKLLLNRYFVYNYASNGGFRHERSYSERAEFKVPESVAAKISDLCLHAIQLSFDESNLIDYFEVITGWDSISGFISETSNNHRASGLREESGLERWAKIPGSKPIIEAVRENHGKITPERIENDLAADKQRIAELIALEDDRITEALLAHRKEVLSQIEKALGLVKGGIFEGLDPNLDPRSLLSALEGVRRNDINNAPREQQYRKPHRSPDELLTKYGLIYNCYYEEVSK